MTKFAGAAALCGLIAATPAHAEAWVCGSQSEGLIKYFVDGNRLKNTRDSTELQIVLNNAFGLVAARGVTVEGGDDITGDILIINKKTGDAAANVNEAGSVNMYGKVLANSKGRCMKD